MYYCNLVYLCNFFLIYVNENQSGVKIPPQYNELNHCSSNIQNEWKNLFELRYSSNHLFQINSLPGKLTLT